MIRLARRLLVLACFVVMTFAGVGCSSYPPALAVRMDRADRDIQSVEVHLIGVTESEYQQLMAMRMTDYWSPMGMGRKQAANRNCAILQLDQKNPSRTLAKDDPHWREWQSSSIKHLMVMSDVSNVPSSVRDTPRDPRRGSIPLDSGSMKYPATITISIGRDGVRFDPPVEHR